MKFPRWMSREKGEIVDDAVAPHWNAELDACVQLMNTHEFEGAFERLGALREELRNSVGFEAKKAEGLVVGQMGVCLLQSLRPDEALGYFEEANLLCEETRDEDGVRAYVGNRMETLRWLGRHREAAPWADRLAALHESNGDPVQAARFRTRARIMAEGEPLLRVLFQVGDRVYEEEEIPVPIEDAARILLERNRIMLLRCARQLEEGGRHVGRNRYDEALASFRNAAQSDPYAPQPHYESASVYMLTGRYQDAIDSYERTERLAPGWFLTRSELWLGQQLAAGRFHADVPRLLLDIEHEAPSRSLELAQALCERFPDLPQAWLLLGERLQHSGQRAEAEVAYRRGLECAEDVDSTTRLLTSLGTVATPPRRAELEQAAALNGNLVAGAAARLVLRSPD